MKCGLVPHGNITRPRKGTQHRYHYSEDGLCEHHTERKTQSPQPRATSVHVCEISGISESMASGLVVARGWGGENR